GLGAAGLLRRPAAAAGGRARRAGDAAVHPGPAAPGGGRPGGPDPGRRPAPGAGRRRRRRRAADPGAPPRAAGRPVLPRRAAAPEAGERAESRPERLLEPDGGGDAMKKLETKSMVLLKHHLKALRRA